MLDARQEAREPCPFCTSILVFAAGSIGGKGGGPTNLQAVPQILAASHLSMVMVTGDSINQAPPMSKVSLIKGTEEWPGDYYPGKLLIGRRARLSQEERGI